MNQTFTKQVVSEAEKHLKELIETYGHGWELYIKCDINGKLRYCPKGEVFKNFADE